jgi:hypothetical protein
MKAFPNMAGQQGMDLRDYFAAKAMQAYLTGDYDLYPNEVAEKAYQVADWMMETRKAK